MERRVTSHTEEEEMNQRRRLLGLARKGDEKAINKLFELYQVKLYTGESFLKKEKAEARKRTKELKEKAKARKSTKDLKAQALKEKRKTSSPTKKQPLPKKQKPAVQKVSRLPPKASSKKTAQSRKKTK